MNKYYLKLLIFRGNLAKINRMLEAARNKPGKLVVAGPCRKRYTAICKKKEEHRTEYEKKVVEYNRYVESRRYEIRMKKRLMGPGHTDTSAALGSSNAQPTYHPT